MKQSKADLDAVLFWRRKAVAQASSLRPAIELLNLADDALAENSLNSVGAVVEQTQDRRDHLRVQIQAFLRGTEMPSALKECGACSCCEGACRLDADSPPACCVPTAEEEVLLAAGDCTPEELWGGRRPTCPKCIGRAGSEQQADQKIEQMARMPVERCYDVRAKMIIAFNEAKKAGGDLDDQLDAAYKSALRFSPKPQ